MPTFQSLEEISGVSLVHFQAFSDNRGRFRETFRTDWFPTVDWSRMQSNRSDSAAGVLRGLHFHHNQVDFWTVYSGTIWVALADLRVGSPTKGESTMLYMNAENEYGLFIPEGVAHGFVAVTAATLVYTVNQYYDGGKDENGVLWSDPELNFDWGNMEPILSPRDEKNPLLRDIPKKDRPVYKP